VIVDTTQLRHSLRRSRMGVRVWLGRYPHLYLPIRKTLKALGWPGGAFIDADTDLVVEGFPRSANTFAVEAVEMAQPDGLSIAHHSHAPAQVLEGVRREIPTIVLVRDPRDAVCSVTLRNPARTLEQALDEYQAFYRSLEDVKDRTVIAPFEVVTTDMGQVIDAVNARCGRFLEPFHHTDENEQACFDRIATEHKARHEGEVETSRIARPAEERERAKFGLRRRYDEDVPAVDRSRARSIYRSFLEASEFDTDEPRTDTDGDQ